MEGKDDIGVKLTFDAGPPEHLQGKKVHTTGPSHEQGDKRWKEEEWSGAPAEHREGDTGVPGTSSPRGKVSETVEGREGWRD